jgi:hypothetical protein
MVDIHRARPAFVGVVVASYSVALSATVAELSKAVTLIDSFQVSIVAPDQIAEVIAIASACPAMRDFLRLLGITFTPSAALSVWGIRRNCDLLPGSIRHLWRRRCSPRFAFVHGRCPVSVDLPSSGLGSFAFCANLGIWNPYKWLRRRLGGLAGHGVAELNISHQIRARLALIVG